jgi:hypothetical protein
MRTVKPLALFMVVFALFYTVFFLLGDSSPFRDSDL